MERSVWKWIGIALAIGGLAALTAYVVHKKQRPTGD
jgi:hypothetical protein